MIWPICWILRHPSCTKLRKGIIVNLPEIIRQAWEEREQPAILATVSKDGIPNIIYVGAVWLYGKDKILVADNYLDKTRKNILRGIKTGAILFITPARKAYQLKGTLSYHKSGKLLDEMKKLNPTKYPGHAAVVLTVEEIYCGAEKIE